MNWLDNVLFCCSKRRDNEQANQMRSIEPAYMDSVEALSPVINYSSKDFPEKSNSQDRESIPHITISREEVYNPFKEVPLLPPTQSRRSTKESFAVLESANLLLSTLNCIDCMEKAVGYCLGCPSKRFCQDCFEKLHPNNNGMHIFCLYKSNVRQQKSRSFINLSQR